MYSKPNQSQKDPSLAVAEVSNGDNAEWATRCPGISGDEVFEFFGSQPGNFWEEYYMWARQHGLQVCTRSKFNVVTDTRQQGNFFGLGQGGAWDMR